MKKFLAAIGLFAMVFTITPQAFADHLPAPYSGQDRVEEVWSCIPNENQMVNLRMFFGTGKFQDLGLPALAWSAAMSELVNSGDCILRNADYVVKEIVEAVRAPVYDEGQYGEIMTFYILRIVSLENGQELLIASF